MEQEETASKQAFQTLYSEMEFYKEDCMLKIENILLQGFLSFYDSISWFRTTLETQTDSEPSDEMNNFALIYDEFNDLLQERNVYPLAPQEYFDSSLHRIVEISPTKDENKHNAIKSVVKKGFKRKDTVLRFEEVVIYQYNEE
jgi:molecular chaperone GrpE